MLTGSLLVVCGVGRQGGDHQDKQGGQTDQHDVQRDLIGGLLAPRPFDLGPITTLTNLGKLPYLKMVLAWTLFALLLVAIFILTH